MKLSLIIPTYNESQNIKDLLLQLKEEFSSNKIDAEIIVIDDNSPDGTGQILERLKAENENLTVIHRKGKLGLSSAVLEGFKASRGDVLCVMDADLSHPLQEIPKMYSIIVQKDADIVIGSRYVEGGKIEGWNFYRKLLSRGAVAMARIFTDIKDPMSGFFMIKKGLVMNKLINPKGFKILLELLIKSNYKNAIETPITFTNRTKGKSKAGIKEILFYLQNLSGYFFYKREVVYEFIKFAIVGLLGTLINLVILYYFTEYFKIYYLHSAIIAFFVAASSNFALNRIWTFKNKANGAVLNKYIKFLIVSLVALSVNIVFLYIFTEFMQIYYIVSQIFAIGISMIINFIGNKIWTFQK